MTDILWTGVGQTDGATATAANSAGTGQTAFTAIVLASGGSAVYDATNPLVTNQVALRLLSSSGTSGSRARAYHAFPAASDSISVRFAVRFRVDPGVATGVYQFVQDNGTTGAGALALTSTSGSRQVIWQDAAGATKANFGSITFGSGLANWYIFDVYTTKGTTTSNGTHGVRMYDYQGNLVGEYVAAGTANAGTAQYIRTTWGQNATTNSDLDVVAIKSTNTAAAFQGLPSAPPPTPPTLPAPATTSDLFVITATATAGSGGTLAYAVSPAAASNPAPGVFGMTRQASTGSDYDAVVTVTESPSGQTASRTVVVPKLAAAGKVNIRAPKIHSGALPGNTWV